MQQHSKCSAKYCLNPDESNFRCRFGYPFDSIDRTRVEFEPVHTKDKSVQYKIKVITKRNDLQLNNHQPIQLKGGEQIVMFK